MNETGKCILGAQYREGSIGDLLAVEKIMDYK